MKSALSAMRICSMVASSTPHSRSSFSSASFQIRHFLSSRPWLYAMLLFLQSELIERAEKNPLIFPKEKTRGLNALNFNFLLSFLVFLGFWLCVCSQRSGLCRTSPRLHAQKVRQKRLPVSIPVHYPTAKAGRLSACPP